MIYGDQADNPFENPVVALRWMKSVESEQGMLRDRYIYPMIRMWLAAYPMWSLVDIGCGQGVCALICQPQWRALVGEYIGVEPSPYLLRRARKLHTSPVYQICPTARFVQGKAEKIPLETEYADGALSVNVWFHLPDIQKAAQEMARVLRRPENPDSLCGNDHERGRFLVITANPDAYAEWRSFYRIAQDDGKRFEGEIDIPHVTLPRSVFYQHTEEEMVTALWAAGLMVSTNIGFGYLEEGSPEKCRERPPLFRAFVGIRR